MSLLKEGKMNRMNLDHVSELIPIVRMITWGGTAMAYLSFFAGVRYFSEGGAFPYHLEIFLAAFLGFLSTRIKTISAYSQFDFTMVGLKARNVQYSDLAWMFEFLCEAKGIDLNAKNKLVIKLNKGIWPFNIYLLTIPSSINIYDVYRKNMVQ